MGKPLASLDPPAEALAGLPGDGPPPRHFHLGHPTPWCEGLVVRFRSPSGSTWIGNFQRGAYGCNAILAWPEAAAIVVLADGACYRVHPAQPASYSTHGVNVTSTLFTEDRALLLLAYEHGDLVALGVDGKPLWARPSLGACGVVLRACHAGLVTVDLETGYDDNWRSVQLRAADGADAN